MARPDRIEPLPGQESVWDYPRPPLLERSEHHVRVEHGGLVLADSRSTWRVLETSQPPAYYVPRDDVSMELLAASQLRTYCEWKGVAAYLDLVLEGERRADVAWYYPDPTPRFAPIAGHVAFYAQRVDACFVEGERVRSNDGDFYGGWITSWVVGPFKGGAGTAGW